MRVGTIIFPAGITLVAEFLTPKRVIESSVESRTFFLKSLTEAHGISPFQYSELFLSGVPPPLISTSSPKEIIGQLTAYPPAHPNPPESLFPAPSTVSVSSSDLHTPPLDTPLLYND